MGALLRESQREMCSHIHPQFVLGDTMNDIARNLYAGLRALDSAGVDVILMTDVPRDGLGEAIADRLQRAAAK
jgi:L-threonylcarbamoyladenylate synthase